MPLGEAALLAARLLAEAGLSVPAGYSAAADAAGALAARQADGDCGVDRPGCRGVGMGPPGTADRLRLHHDLLRTALTARAAERALALALRYLTERVLMAGR